MKCVSCETEINPKWTHAIDMNVCPFCGEFIVEEELKNLLTSLRTTMESLQKYPDQLNDWLLSNFNYIRTDSQDLMLYMPKDYIKSIKKELDNEDFEKRKSIVKIKTENGEEEVIVEKVQSQSKTKSFFDRAEVVKKSNATDEPKSVAERTQHLKAMANKIRQEGSPSIMNEEGLATMINVNGTEKANPEDVAELQSFIHSGDLIASGLPEAASGDDDEIPAVVSNMAARAAAKGGSGVNEKDLQSLREMQNKVKNAQQNFSSGNGKFSRA